ncbi:Arsenical-resistance protein ACR3 [hydrothermal vent metagenome]|uniref:Arsenical-resistance protein ACR3 n=1 Tax=hydrothermal vent metagenome TaxID=652676 RepID=A0A3B1B1P1_9ZZZZ
MGLFERYLTLWMLLCMVVGIGLGYCSRVNFKP